MKEDPDTLGAYLARENMKLGEANERLYNKLRKLEEKVRLHTRNDCGCKSPHLCLSRLGDLIPKNPRPTLKEARTRRTQK